jgi:hypothetical protein
MPEDDQTPDTGDGSETEDATPAKPQPGKDWQAEADKWKALARKHEKAAADLRPLADKAQQLEDAGKTEIERLTEQLAQAQRSANDAEARALRFEVAAEHKLTPAQAKWLQGANRDELEANVAELLEAFSAGKPAQPEPTDEPAEDPEPDRDPNPRRRPQERLRPGAVPDADVEPVETDPRKLAAAIRRDVF